MNVSVLLVELCRHKIKFIYCIESDFFSQTCHFVSQIFAVRDYVRQNV